MTANSNAGRNGDIRATGIQGPSAIAGVPSSHVTASNYVYKDEEDAVVDYNAPITWW